MKRILLTLFSCLVFNCLLQVQELGADGTNPPQIASASSNVGNPVEEVNRVSTLIGMDVRNLEDERLGEVKELMLDLKSARVVYVALATGGVLGVGDKLLALPPAALRTGTNPESLLLKADRKTIEQASGFDTANWPAVADATFDADTAYASIKDHQITEAAGAETSAAAATEDSGRLPLGATMSFIKASEMLGMPVQNEQRQKLGDISDLAVDLKSGEIRYAVLSSGGFLGLGEKLYAVPIDSLTLAGPKKMLVMDATLDTFKLARSFDKTQWPSQADQALTRRNLRLHETFGEAAGARRVEPDDGFSFPGSSVQSSGELTATDQSNDASDLELTRNLRQAIVRNEELSFGAKNITIITFGSTVTLRGIVESREEREKVSQIARELAGGRKVRDQLTIKTN